MDRLQFLKKIDSAWKQLNASYEGLPDSDLLASGVTGNWSMKDIIAHVTLWEEEALKHAPIVLAGGKPPKYSTTYGGIDAFNAKMTKQRRNLSLDEVLQQRDETHHRLVEFIKTVPEDQIARETKFRRRIRLDTYRHYAKHAEEIQKWREHRSTG